MPTRHAAPLLFLFLALPSWAAPAAPADLEAFVRALPATGANDRVFLDLPPELQARLGIDPAALRRIDPGLACDPGAATRATPEATLGRAGHVQTACMPGGYGVGVLTLPDGRTWSTTCGESGLRVRAWADVTVGEHSLHASTESPAPTRVPTHACTGWTKQSR